MKIAYSKLFSLFLIITFVIAMVPAVAADPEWDSLAKTGAKGDHEAYHNWENGIDTGDYIWFVSCGFGSDSIQVNKFEDSTGDWISNTSITIGGLTPYIIAWDIVDGETNDDYGYFVVLASEDGYKIDGTSSPPFQHHHIYMYSISDAGSVTLTYNRTLSDIDFATNAPDASWGTINSWYWDGRVFAGVMVHIDDGAYQLYDYWVCDITNNVKLLLHGDIVDSTGDTYYGWAVQPLWDATNDVMYACAPGFLSSHNPDTLALVSELDTCTVEFREPDAYTHLIFEWHMFATATSGTVHTVDCDGAIVSGGTLYLSRTYYHKTVEETASGYWKWVQSGKWLWYPVWVPASTSDVCTCTHGDGMWHYESAFATAVSPVRLNWDATLTNMLIYQRDNSNYYQATVQYNGDRSVLSESVGVLGSIEGYMQGKNIEVIDWVGTSIWDGNYVVGYSTDKDGDNRYAYFATNDLDFLNGELTEITGYWSYNITAGEILIVPGQITNGWDNAVEPTKARIYIYNSTANLTVGLFFTDEGSTPDAYNQYELRDTVDFQENTTAWCRLEWDDLPDDFAYYAFVIAPDDQADCPINVTFGVEVSGNDLYNASGTAMPTAFYTKTLVNSSANIACHVVAVTKPTETTATGTTDGSANIFVFTYGTTVYDITGGSSTSIASGFYAMADEIGIDRSAFGILLTLICFFALWFISSAWSKEMPQNIFFVVLLFAGSASMWAFVGVLPISVWVGFMAIVALLLFSKLREV